MRRFTGQWQRRAGLPLSLTIYGRATAVATGRPCDRKRPCPTRSAITHAEEIADVVCGRPAVMCSGAILAVGLGGRWRIGATAAGLANGSHAASYRLMTDAQSVRERPVGWNEGQQRRRAKRARSRPRGESRPFWAWQRSSGRWSRPRRGLARPLVHTAAGFVRPAWIRVRADPRRRPCLDRQAGSWRRQTQLHHRSVVRLPRSLR